MTLTLSFICFHEALPGWRWRRRCCCLDILVDLFKQLGSCRILLIQSFSTATIWILPPFSFLSGCISNNLPHCRASLQGELLATFMHCSYCFLHRLPLRVEPFSGNCIHLSILFTASGELHIALIKENMELYWNIYPNSYIFIQGNAFEMVVCAMATVLSRLQCVKWNHRSRPGKMTVDYTPLLLFLLVLPIYFTCMR